MNENKVYIMQAVVNGHKFVKIGISNDPKRRLADIRVGSPIRVDLVSVLIAEPWREHYLHQKFQQFHFHGEWFKSTFELERFVDCCSRIAPFNMVEFEKRPDLKNKPASLESMPGRIHKKMSMPGFGFFYRTPTEEFPKPVARVYSYDDSDFYENIYHPPCKTCHNYSDCGETGSEGYCWFDEGTVASDHYCSYHTSTCTDYLSSPRHRRVQFLVDTAEMNSALEIVKKFHGHMLNAHQRLNKEEDAEQLPLDGFL